LAPGQGPGRVERLGVADPDPLVDDLAVERLGDEVLADPLDLPRAGRVAREDRALGVGADHADGGVLLLEVAADARDRPAGADTRDERGHAAPGLLPDLGPGGAVVDLGVGEVAELVRP